MQREHGVRDIVFVRDWGGYSELLPVNPGRLYDSIADGYTAVVAVWCTRLVGATKRSTISGGTTN